VSIHKSGAELAVGSKEGKVHLFNVSSNTLTPSKVG
jgi:hypothetical protein